MQHVRANGIEIACEITGRGPPIVLCHGGEADHGNFFNFAPALVDAFTVIAYDQRDTGETRNGEQPYAVSDLGADVCALIQALGYPRAHVFGTSFGGIIAQEAALHDAARIDRLILSASWPGGAWPVTDEFYAVVLAQKTAEQARDYRQMFFSTKFAAAQAEEVEARMQRVMTVRTPEQQARRGASNALHEQAAVRLPGISNHSLVLAGAGDRIVSPDFSRQLAELIPNSELVILEELGHATTIEDPARVADVVRAFIARPAD